MYLHIGGDTVVNTKNIIGIFDMDNSTVSYKTREFLSEAQKKREMYPTTCRDPLYYAEKIINVKFIYASFHRSH